MPKTKSPILGESTPTQPTTRRRNPETYGEQRQLMDFALEQTKGLVKELPTYGKAFNFRMRCHGVRKQDRAANAKLYDDSHPNHGRSIYDELIISIEPVDPKEKLTKNWSGPSLLFILKKEKYMEDLTTDPTIRSL